LENPPWSLQEVMPKDWGVPKIKAPLPGASHYFGTSPVLEHYPPLLGMQSPATPKSMPSYL